MTTTLNDLAKEIHDNAVAHGFWPDGGRNFAEMLMLATSELSEALEEHRDGKPAHYYKCKKCGRESDVFEAYHDKPSPVAFLEHTKCHGLMKPEGAAVELADCIIRCLDTMASLDVDVAYLVREKMDYNASRAYLHGRQY